METTTRKQEVITRLCALASVVGDKEFQNRHAHDCFCHKSLMECGFQFSDNVLEFIEQAVHEKLNRTAI